MNFATFHACDEKSKQHVRSPTPDEIDDAPRPLGALLELEPYGRAFATRLKEIDRSLPAGIGQLHELQEAVGVATLCCLLAFACQTQNVANIELGRAALLAAPRAWVVGHLVRAAKSTLDLDDPWEVRRLLEISTKLDTALAQAFGADLRLHANDEVREAAADLVPKTE